MSINIIKSNSPNAWADFIEFYDTNFGNTKLKIETLPFEFLVGVYLVFFSENGIEIDLGNIELQELENEIIKTFAWQEVNRNHFS